MEKQLPAGMERIAQTAYLDRTAGTTKLALLFGWTNGTLKNVSKYGAFYKARGSAVFCFTQLFATQSRSATGIYYLPTRIKQVWVPIVSKLAGLLPGLFTNDSAPPVTEVVIHVFSGGGSANLNKFLEALKMLSLRFHEGAVRLLVVDSAPTSGGIKQSAEFILPVWFNPVTRSPFQMVAAYSFSLGTRPFVTVAPAIWEAVVGRRKGEWTFSDEVDGALCDTERALGGVPRLFIYSNADRLMEPGRVEEYSKVVLARCKVEVRLKRFEDTWHVAHVMKYPRQYWEAVEAALERRQERPVVEIVKSKL